ncbi:Zinc finger domain-containing protein, MYND-type [Cordyceps militaris CM01]|uniref:Zinc finger domain-containing protein, MYND-type n=1 Tax=Cordyceps militaris (strain CM01) TaxID=983644 RepID=G3JBX9_CORMM|nr:Zinc finger domain-containing protein, MYND-type [Cordyceps militaris CM01]EGX93697.1 Zinc finger domain-containing protein, MYND-type [Cordyceps militaris CM01]
METTARTYKGIIGPLENRCSHCQARAAKLLRCVGCSAVRYCNREHQTAHWPHHKPLCVQIKQARAQLAEEEQRLRQAPADFWTPANVFETQVGHFWGLVGTRDYMRARFLLAGDLLPNVGTLCSIKEALKHLRDMLRLCRGDNMGVRNMVPAMMLRLDRDQECYDFAKWWATCDPDGRYDWGDMSLPYLSTRNADVFERPDFFSSYPSINGVSAILLLKLKLLVDIRNIRVARKIFAQRSTPLDICRLIERELIRSPLSKRFLEDSSQTLIQLECKLIRHARELGATLIKANEHYVPALLEPDGALSHTPAAYSPGSWEEMALSLRYCYAAWWETAGVLELLRDAQACAAAELQDEFQHLVLYDTDPYRTAEDGLEELSIYRIWVSLDHAVENASYLGPWSDRPSERYRRIEWIGDDSDDELDSDDEYS